MFDFDLAEWWEKKNKDNKVWFLYKLLAILAITVGYIAGDGAIRYTAMGVIVLLVLHLVIWPFFTETTSTTTKIFVGGFLVFCVFGFLFPNLTDRVVSSTKNWGLNIDKGHGATVAKELTKERRVRNVETVSLRVNPSARFKAVDIPSGVMAGWDCPDGCVIEIEHNGERLCQNGLYKGAECRAMTISSSTPRHLEQFQMLPGMDVDFPQTMDKPSTRFGTTHRLGPVDVLITIAR